MRRLSVVMLIVLTVGCASPRPAQNLAITHNEPAEVVIQYDEPAARVAEVPIRTSLRAGGTIYR